MKNEFPGLLTKRGLLDCILSPFVLCAGWLLGKVRALGLGKMPMCRGALQTVGVLPVRRHYYEPLFDPRDLSKPRSTDRLLPGIDWNEAGQLNLLSQFVYGHELDRLPDDYVDDTTYYFNNTSFGADSAGFLHNLVRLKKPRRVIEVGCGFSTRIIQHAILRNQQEDEHYACRHLCIEPYEEPALEKMGVMVMRERVEHVDRALFEQLEANDLLFIDSSHMIRPQGGCRV